MIKKTNEGMGGTRSYFLDRNGIPTSRLVNRVGMNHIDIAKVVLNGGRDFAPGVEANTVYQQMFAHGFVRVAEDANTVWVEHVRPLTKKQKDFFEDIQFEKGKNVVLNSRAFVERKETQIMRSVIRS